MNLSQTEMFGLFTTFMKQYASTSQSKQEAASQDPPTSLPEEGNSQAHMEMSQLESSSTESPTLSDSDKFDISKGMSHVRGICH